VDELQDMPVSRAKKGKVDALWQQLRQGTAVSKPKPIGSLMSLERKSAISRSSKGKGSDVVGASTVLQLRVCSDLHERNLVTCAIPQSWHYAVCGWTHACSLQLLCTPGRTLPNAPSALQR
jgi:hypothetical protein